MVPPRHNAWLVCYDDLYPSFDQRRWFLRLPLLYWLVGGTILSRHYAQYVINCHYPHYPDLANDFDT